jgi:alkylation response protein AidB-like acyl-CoA dehydrogenase
MDLRPSEDQTALCELIHRILHENLPAERHREVEAGETGLDPDLWKRLADAGGIGAALATDVGGGGLGFLEACLILEQIGRTAAPLPYLATVILGALPIDRFGSPRQRQELLPPVVAGTTLLTGALADDARGGLPTGAGVRARRTDAGWQLDGEKWFVPAAHVAHRMLVPARTDGDHPVILLVDPLAAGVRLTRLDTTAVEPEFVVGFDAVSVSGQDVLGTPEQGAEILAWTVQAGVCAAALQLTARHVSEREQFGARIGTFQAVAQRAADAYIDTEAVTLCARQAAWRLDEGLPAGTEIAIAKHWAADAGQRVAHAAQHLHGGIGVDTDYPLHRLFRRTRQIELTLGGSHEHLVRLGDMLADGETES